MISLKKSCSTIILAALCILPWLTNGCIRQQVTPPSPAWARNGSGAFNTWQGKMFYGVGVAAGINNRSLLRAAADNHARDAMANVLTTYVAALVKAYSARHQIDSVALTQKLGASTRSTLENALITAHWINSENSELFALCQVDLKALKQTLIDDPSLSTTLRDFIHTRAEDVHTEMANQ